MSIDLFGNWNNWLEELFPEISIHNLDLDNVCVCGVDPQIMSEFMSNFTEPIGRSYGLKISN